VNGLVFAFVEEGGEVGEISGEHRHKGARSLKGIAWGGDFVDLVFGVRERGWG
jgi:hypothetical protein